MNKTKECPGCHRAFPIEEFGGLELCIYCTEKFRLGDCTCINEAAARTLEELVDRAIAEAENFIKAPYGASPEIVDFYKKRLENFHIVEDAIKSLDICPKPK